MVSNMKRLAALYIAVCLIILICADKVSCASYYNIANGYALIEMEDIVIDNDNIFVEFNTAASGKKVVRVIAEKYSPDSIKVENPSLGTTIYADKDGVYYIWLYVYAAKDYNRSIFVSPDGGDSYRLYSTKTYGKWTWINCGITVVEDGKSTIYFKRRDIQFVADKMIVTADSTFNPRISGDLPQNAVAKELTELYLTPETLPPATHPRLHLTSDIISEVKKNLQYEPMNKYYLRANLIAQNPLNCTLPKTYNITNCNSDYLYQFRSRAFLYAIGELDDDKAYELISELRDFLNTFECSTDTANTQEDYIAPVLETSAMVYDWCYDLLTDEDKTFLISKMLKNMRMCGYPYTDNDSIGVAGKNGEDRFLRGILSASVAIYDEYPDAYICTAGLIYEKYIRTRELYYKSGKYPVGNSYSMRMRNDFAGALMYDRWGVTNFFGEDMASVARTWLHEQQPDGYLFKYDDDTMYSYKSSYKNVNHLSTSMLLASLYSEDPYISAQWAKVYDQYGIANNLDEIWILLYGRTNWETKTPDDLPLVRYTGYPLTSLSTRTSWQYGMDAPNAMVNMNMKNIQLGDHSHLDVGSFQIFYKGGLAIDSGIYQGADTSWGSNYDFNYHKRTVAHNAITVYDPNESVSNYYATITTSSTVLNDGGQHSVTNLPVATYNEMISSNVCTEKAHFIGPNETTPHFAYIKGDLTNAYTDKVAKHERSFVYMDLFNNNYPMALVVFDKLNVKDASFKKSFLLHSEEEPNVNAENGVITISKTKNPGDNGKLINKTILPSPNETDYEIIGGEGYEYYYNGNNLSAQSRADSVDYELSGNWRVEQSPKQVSKENFFMNAMYVMDADSELPELNIVSESYGNYVGVTVRDRFVLVSKADELNESSMSVTLHDNGFENIYCFITDMKEGTWKITGNGYSQNVSVKENENTLFFEAPCGEYTIQYAADESVQEQLYAEVLKEKPGDFYILYNGLYMYMPQPNKLIDGETFIPVKSVLEHLGASVTQNSNCAIIIYNDTSQTLTEGRNVSNVGNKEITLKSTPFIENNIIYANSEDFEELLKMDFTYNGFSKMLSVENKADNHVYWDEDFSNTTGDIRLISTADHLLKDEYENPVFTNVARNSGDSMAYDKWRLRVRTAAETDAGSLYFFRTADASANDSNVTFEKRFSEVISGGFNIEYSVKPQSGSYRFIIGVDKTISSSSWGPSILDIGNTSFASDEIRVSNQSIKYTNGKWHHFVLSFNGAGKCDIYMDGVPMFKNVSSSNTLGRLKFTAITYANTAAECYFDNFKIYQSSDFGDTVKDNDCTLSSNQNKIDNSLSSVTVCCNPAEYTAGDLKKSLITNAGIAFYDISGNEITDETNSISEVSKIVAIAQNGIAKREYSVIIRNTIESDVYSVDITNKTISGVLNYTLRSTFLNNLRLYDDVSIAKISKDSIDVGEDGLITNGTVITIKNGDETEDYTVVTPYIINNDFIEYAGKLVYSDNKGKTENYPGGFTSVMFDHAWMSATSNTNGLSVIKGVQKDGNDVLQFYSDLSRVSSLGGSYTGKRYIGKTFSEPLTGKVYIACSVYMDDMNTARQLVLRSENANGFMIPASFDTDGILTVCGKKYPYQIGKWYNIEVCMDLDNDIQTIYINNIKVNMRYKIAGFKKMSLVRFEDFVVPGKTASLYLDNFIVYQTSENAPVFEVSDNVEFLSEKITFYKDSVSDTNELKNLSDAGDAHAIIANIGKVNNFTLKDIHMFFFIASYEGSELTNVSKCSAQLVSGEKNENLQCSLTLPKNTSLIKAFLWEKDTMLPLIYTEQMQ